MRNTIQKKARMIKKMRRKKKNQRCQFPLQVRLWKPLQLSAASTKPGQEQ
jgi:hypothetical protein